jgi:hypothetical protein
MEIIDKKGLFKQFLELYLSIFFTTCKRGRMAKDERNGSRVQAPSVLTEVSTFKRYLSILAWRVGRDRLRSLAA